MLKPQPLSRRQLSAALIGLTAKADRPVTGAFLDDSHRTGHALRDRTLRLSSKRQVRTGVVIAGGGIAGLSAAWRMHKRGRRDFVLLEMNAEAGGNSRYGGNEITRYPWAAHYVPVPNKESVLVRELFEELGVLENGEWNERYLCYSPQERLYIHGRWQEGIEPELASTRQDRLEFQRFHSLMAEQRETRQFTIPSALGAKPSPLDRLSAQQWLEEQKFRSEYLHWYVDYACRDDYGARAGDTSAWAAVHYFAAREHDEKGPLTWPEGNGWIVRRLLEQLAGYVHTGMPVHRILKEKSAYRVLAGDTEYHCSAVIFAAPSFVAPYLADWLPALPKADYSPWITANVTLDRLPRETRGAPVAWDNVVYGSPTLGYVVATHMSLSSHLERSVWTWYFAMADGTPAENRRLLLDKDWGYWKEFVLTDLARAHPDIRECVSRIDLLRLGHAMARPAPGFRSRPRPDAPPGFYFANSDCSGFSIFEEAQYHGVQAADAALKRI